MDQLKPSFFRMNEEFLTANFRSFKPGDTIHIALVSYVYPNFGMPVIKNVILTPFKTKGKYDIGSCVIPPYSTARILGTVAQCIESILKNDYHLECIAPLPRTDVKITEDEGGRKDALIVFKMVWEERRQNSFTYNIDNLNMEEPYFVLFDAVGNGDLKQIYLNIDRIHHLHAKVPVPRISWEYMRENSREILWASTPVVVFASFFRMVS
jgi:hypothetical protein